MWEVSLPIGIDFVRQAGQCAVMRNVSSHTPRVLVKTCASVEEAETYIETLNRQLAASAGPYGDVTYADPKNKKYPVDTAAHARAAWSYINKPANAAVYPLNGVTVGDVKAKIRAACKKFGITLSD